MSEDGSVAKMTRGLHELTGGRRPAVRRQERRPRRAAAGRDPGAAGLRPRHQRVCGFHGGGGLAPAADAAQAAAMRTAIGSAPVPGAVRDEIAARYAELATAVGDPSPPMAVALQRARRGRCRRHLRRSAGHHPLGPRRAGHLRRRQALLGQPVQHRGGQLPPPVRRRRRSRDGVTVQLMVDAAVSGVMFTCNPVSGDPSMIAINASWGPGAGGGGRRGDARRLPRQQDQPARWPARASAPRTSSTCPRPTVAARFGSTFTGERRSAPCLDDAARRALVDISRRIERHFGGHQDIEWAIARGRPAPAGCPSSKRVRSRRCPSVRRRRRRPHPPCRW